MTSLFDVLQFMNPLVSLGTVNVGSPNGYEEIISWDISIGSQPTQAEIDAARPLATAALITTAIRAERNRRLATTDYQAMPDYPDAKKPAGLTAYRQALRDFPATANVAALDWPLDVNALVWPVL